jgi:hypothetical protein
MSGRSTMFFVSPREQWAVQDSNEMSEPMIAQGIAKTHVG